mmetsp:Transcript_107555/g.195645  ORF Transcript_107555/g.195645 Transcript_107555/m.195645 type:complete len:534 (+) Transcript_107555:122-1723(+)
MDVWQIWDYISENWHLFLYAYLAISFIRSLFSKEPAESENTKKQDGSAGASKLMKEGRDNIPPVNQVHLSPRKSLGIAYVYFVLGGFVTGTHHIYLGHHAWAVCHSCSGGFMFVGSAIDAVLLPFYVWRANGAVTCHALAPQDSVITLCRSLIITAVRWFVKGGFVLFIVIVLVPSLFEFAYDADLSEGGHVFQTSPYKVLGVSRFAGTQEIKNSYKSLSKQYHPDRNAGCEDCAKRMGEINDAWDKLKRRGAVPGGSTGFREEHSGENEQGNAEDSSEPGQKSSEWANRLDKKWQTLINVGARKMQSWSEWTQSSKASKRKKRAKAWEEGKKEAGKTQSSKGGEKKETKEESDLLKVLMQAQSQKNAPLTIEDFAYMLKHLSGDEADKFVDKSLAPIKKEFDGNGDGKISLKDLLPGDGAERYLSEMFASWKTSFLDADESKDGYLNDDEFAYLLKNLTSEQIDELLDPIDSIMKKLDTDTDGKISLEELLQKAPSWMHSGWKDGFKGADANKDAKLASEELVHLLNHVGKR